MTVDVARLQSLLDAVKVAEGLELGKALWALNNAAADALPALLVCGGRTRPTRGDSGASAGGRERVGRSERRYRPAPG